MIKLKNQNIFNFRFFKFILIILIFVFPIFLIFSYQKLSASSIGSAPALHFSDIISGPKTGNSDGAGGLDNSEHGSIITIWGNNLGSSQGLSKVFFKDSINNIYEAAHIYYWTNADGKSGGGPADLYTYHKMQEISFSIPSSVANGLGAVYVEVDGTKSNELPFTVRSGNIYFVKTTGDNNNNGTWGSPWQQVSYDASGGGAASKVSNGDIVYVCDGVEEINTYVDGARDAGIRVRDANATESAPIAIITYPGALVLAQGNNYGILNHGVEYWVFSKIKVRAGTLGDSRGAGIESNKGGRIIGNEVSNRPGEYADGQQGAIAGNALNGDKISNCKVLGNYIHDWGGPGTSKLEHTTYFSNRSHNSDNLITIEAPELGWNYLKNNYARGGLHVYDEYLTGEANDLCGNMSGTLRIHDNAVVNQRGSAINIGTEAYAGPDVVFSMPVEIYNNIVINGGQGPSQDGDRVSTAAISFGGHGNRSHVKVYNNTIYGYGDLSVPVNLRAGNAGIITQGDFNGQIEFVNNIVYDTTDMDFANIEDESKIGFHSNNNWYNGGDGAPVVLPTWDSGSFSADPQFNNPSVGDLSLQSTSSLIDNGLASFVSADIFGTSRPQGSAYDIGAYEYVQVSSVPACTSFTYSSWSDCQSNNTQTRTLVSSLPSGCAGGTPILSQSCTYTTPTCTSFTYSTWGACQSSNIQIRTVISSLPNNCTGGSPILSQDCQYSNNESTPSTCTSFAYSDWGSCLSTGKQSRSVIAQDPPGCTGGDPVYLKDCVYTATPNNSESDTVMDSDDDTTDINIDTNIDSDNDTLGTKETLAYNNYKHLNNLANVDSSVVETVTKEESRATYARNSRVSLSKVNIPIYEKIVSLATKQLSIQNKYSIAEFIHNGTLTTKILGSGERAGVISSFQSAFAKLPETESDWQDIIKIANGRWPKKQNKNREANVKKEIFKKIYLRSPDMDNPHDNAAITIITYGLRPVQRNMDSEKAGIKTFEYIYNYSPRSAQDWDIVRAIAYSGAVR